MSSPGSLDVTGSGSWFGVNDDGVAAGVLNRVGTLGPAADKRSRGELVLEALEHANASSAAEALSQVDPDFYRRFNMVVADSSSVFWLRHTEAMPPRQIERMALPEGVPVLTAPEASDPSSARIRRYLPLFRQAAPPDPERGN